MEKQNLIKQCKWVIWSNEHTAFWGEGHRGYVSFVEDAGRYSFEEAFKICKGSLELAFRRGMAYQKDLTNDQQEITSEEG